ncbi:MAG: tetratricopeptide (TPR) repeat protein, partial [Myxococcota bacterium]
QRFGLVGDPRRDVEQVDDIALALTGLVPTPRLDEAVRQLASLMGLGRGGEIPGLDARATSDATFVQLAQMTALNLVAYDTTRQPMLVVLDDADEASPDTLSAAQTLITALASKPVTVLSIGKVAPSLRSQSAEHVLEIPPLSLDETERLLATLMSNVDALPEQLLATTAAQAAGNPALAEELVRLLVHREVIHLDGDRWTFTGADYEAKTIPADLSTSVLERLDELPDADQEALELAAVMAPVVWLGAVISMGRAEAKPEETGLHLDRDPIRLRLEGALLALEERGVLVRAKDDWLREQTGFVFASDTVRDNALKAIAPERLERLNRLAAQWLAMVEPKRQLPWLSAMARHLEDGRRNNDAAREYRAAGDAARAKHTLTDATTHYDAGLRLCGPDAAALRATLLSRRARIAMDLGRFEAGERLLLDSIHFAAVVESATEAGEAHVLLGQCLRSLGQLDRALEHVEYAQELLTKRGSANGATIGDAREEIARIITERGDQQALPRALDLLKKVLLGRRAGNDPHRTVRTLTFMGTITRSLGLLDSAIETHTEALKLAEQISDERGRLSAASGLASAWFEVGKQDSAIALWEEALGRAIELEDQATQATISVSLGAAHAQTGRYDEASALLDHALSVSTQLGLSRIVGWAHSVRSTMYRQQGAESQAVIEADAACDVGYAIESKEVLAKALLARAQALSNALFSDSPAESDRDAQAATAFKQAIGFLESMGERPELIKGLEAFGRFKLERDDPEGHALVERAGVLRSEVLGKHVEVAVHEARTIRRQYQAPKPEETRETFAFPDPRKPSD